jgi:hypothetical protein
VVTDEEFKTLTARVDDLQAQIEALAGAVEQVLDLMNAEIMADIDEMLGDQPDVSPAMIEALRVARTRSSN